MTADERALDGLPPGDRLAALIEQGRTGGDPVEPDGAGWVPGAVVPSARDEPATGRADGSVAGPGGGSDRVVTRRVSRIVEGLRGSGVRLDPGRRGAWSVAVVVVLVAALVGWRVLADRPRSSPVAVTSSIAAASGLPATPSTVSGVRSGPASTVTASLVVDVVGRVRRPGLVRLRAGSRVDDALRAAGGVLPGTDLTALNLARPVVDGEQIAVGVTGAASGPVGPGSAGGTASGAPVDLNTATLEQLDSLPGVGPVLAQHILDWRTAHGRFTSVAQLNDVSGIGDAKFADLKSLVTV